MRRRLAVLALALVVRVVVLVYASGLPTFSRYRLDEHVYDAAGRALASGDLALGREVFHMSPGYSYFVGAVYALAGDGPWPIRIAQLLLGLGVVALVMASARRLVGEPWATIAGVVAALYGPLAFYETLLLAASLSAFAYALVIWLSLRAVEAPSVKRWAVVGLALGLCVVVRPNALLFAPLLAIYAWRGSRRAMLAWAAALALVIAPVTLRNLVVAGELVWVTDSGGLNFFIGNGKGAIGTFRVPRDVPDALNAERQFPAFRAVAERFAGHELSDRAVDAFWYEVAFKRIRNDTGGWARLMLRKLALYWNARELPNTEDYAFARVVNPALRPLVGFGVLAPFALVGTLLLLLRSRAEARLVGGLDALSCAGVVIFFVLAHYRVTAVPGLIVAAIYAAKQLHESARSPRRAARLLVGLALAVVVDLRPTRLPDAMSDQWFKLGYVYQVDGHLDDAGRCYARALAADASNREAEENLALLYEQRGRTDDARAAWQKARALAVTEGNDDGVRKADRHLAR